MRAVSRLPVQGRSCDAGRVLALGRRWWTIPLLGVALSLLAGVLVWARWSQVTNACWRIALDKDRGSVASPAACNTAVAWNRTFCGMGFSWTCAAEGMFLMRGNGPRDVPRGTTLLVDACIDGGGIGECEVLSWALQDAFDTPHYI